MNKITLRKLLRDKLKYNSKKKYFTLGILEYYFKKQLLINFKNLYFSYKKLQKSKILSLYYPLYYEIDCKPIIKWLWQKNLIVTLPKTVANNKVLKFCVFNKTSELKKNFMGIMEPKDNILMNPEVIIVPLIGFDSQGYRLGQGKGYYDATIHNITNNLNVTVIGLSYSWQEVTTTYHNERDIKLDAVVTEKFYKFFNR